MKRKHLKKLILAIIYETSWKEEIYKGETIDRSWKTYPFELLDELEEEGLINNSKKAKSVTITLEGVQKAKKIVEDLEGNNRHEEKES